MIRRPPRSTLFPYTTSSDLVFGIRMHFHHDAVSTRGDRCTRHRDHFVAQAGAVRRVGDDRQMRQLVRSEEHTSELQSRLHLVCRLLLEKKKKIQIYPVTYVV